MQIEDTLKNKIKILGKDVNLKFRNLDDRIVVQASGFLNGSKKNKRETSEIMIKKNKVVCLDCSRKLGDYYEAILQIRGDVDRTVDFLTDQLEMERSVYKVEKVGNGIDIYLDDSHLASIISKKLRNKFKAKIKSSFKLYTRKQGKDIYRSTIVVRI